MLHRLHLPHAAVLRPFVAFIALASSLAVGCASSVPDVTEPLTAARPAAAAAPGPGSSARVAVTPPPSRAPSGDAR